MQVLVRLESDEEQEYIEWTKENDILCEKVKFAVNGYPDRVSILPNGVTVWIEFKRGKATPVPLQYHRLREIRARGAYAGWTNSAPVAILCARALLGAPCLPRAGDTFDALTKRRRLIHRPWFREDFNLFSCYQNLKSEGFDWQGAYYSALEGRVQSVAGRNRKVGKLPKPNL